MFWKSVVGKLWMTIILLFSFVLFILTVLLLEFFHNQSMEEAKSSLFRTAKQVEMILEEHSDIEQSTQIVWQIIDPNKDIVIILDDTNIYSSLNDLNKKEVYQLFSRDETLKKSLVNDRQVSETTYLSSILGGDNVTQGTIVGIPITNDGMDGAIYAFQSVDSSESTNAQTTIFILIAVGIGIVLTTIFAFFLLSRVTAPLRKMREAASELARGKFDMKVPILTNDEIGELAIAFNQMARQLKYNMTALQQEKENLSNILINMADGVIMFNRDGEILVTNPPADDFLRYSFLDETNQKKQSGNQVPDALSDLFLEVKGTGKAKIAEITTQGHDWVILMNPLYRQNDIRGAVAVLRDMTEERRLDKMRKDFIANVSHELRTPIAMLQGYSEAIIDDIAETADEKKEMAQVIYDESLRMGRLVNELLDLARMEAGHQTLNIEEVEVGSFLGRISKKFQRAAQEKNVDVYTTLDHPEALVELDPDRIEQVFTNLIDNALRHTPGGGEVQIIQRTLDNGTQFDVKDSGVGISEEELPFVFERFYKVDKARTRGRAGTGLGLAIAKNIIHGHGGKIDVYSKVGQGTTFTFFLPAKK
ncbi:ATP-binding protein [Bacillus sp. D386]|uniref:ATP-binding protein n=1 Tax=Bacillus sp. D386 TaxID=2587155 RepID=UPI00112073B0|nr:ATP-binding protein [Bacillus sp. D386]